VSLTFRKKNLKLAEAAGETLKAEKPMTLRQLFYRLISAGVLSNTPREYNRLGAILTRLREAGEVDRRWVVDHVRNTLKPSSWSGLADFGEAVRDSYRKDFWASLPDYVEIFVEKDAIAGTIQPVTYQYDVPLRVCRGYSSVSFAGEIADDWAEIDKPVFAYYLGDFDPSGFDLERDLREKLARYSGRPVVRRESLMNSVAAPCPTTVCWQRLAILEEDFDAHGLIRLPVKEGDRRAKAFIREHGGRCAEVDALPPNDLRDRVRQAIEGHIDAARWERLRAVERAERETLEQYVSSWPGKGS
jgi:hypothetical protein